nr:hypothetical protein [Mammaliicoccus sp. Marseille-Q6498]
MLIENILSILPYFATMCFIFSLIGYKLENKRMKQELEILKTDK